MCTLFDEIRQLASRVPAPELAGARRRSYRTLTLSGGTPPIAAEGDCSVRWLLAVGVGKPWDYSGACARHPAVINESQPWRLGQCRAAPGVNPRLAIVITLAAVLVIGITGLVAYADGGFSRPFDARFWRLRLLEPALLLYWLAAPIFATRSYDRVVATLRGIILLTEKQVDSICAESRIPAARLRIAACVFVGMLIGTLVGHPWVASTDSVWAVAVRWGLDVLVWGLIGGFVADTLVRVRLTARLHRAPLTLDLLDLTPLTPVAAWGLSLVWVIAGSATIAAVAIFDAGIITVSWAPIVTIYFAMAHMAGLARPEVMQMARAISPCLATVAA